MKYHSLYTVTRIYLMMFVKYNIINLGADMPIFPESPVALDMFDFSPENAYHENTLSFSNQKRGGNRRKKGVNKWVMMEQS